MKKLALLLVLVLLVGTARAGKLAKSLIAGGYVTKLDCPVGQAWMKSRYWHMADYAGKQNIAASLAEECGQKTISIRNSQDGKELGGINLWDFYVK